MSTSEGTPGKVRLLRRIRVLLVSRDDRFLSVARFLLARNQLAVESTSNWSEVFTLVRQGVDVVVVDGSDSLATAALTVAAIEALHPEIGVIVVAEESDLPGRVLRPLPKWGSLTELVEEIERVYLHLHPRERPVRISR